jgi:hypothetical protein
MKSFMFCSRAKSRALPFGARTSSRAFALRRAAAFLGLQLTCLAGASAQGPEEPSDSAEAPPTLVELELPKKKTKAAKESGGTSAGSDSGSTNGGISDPADATPDNELNDSVPGDPWGDAQGLNLISLRALSQFRYVSTFAQPSESSRSSYAVREDTLVQDGDGWGFQRLLVRFSSDPVKYVGFKTVVDFAELFSGDTDDFLKQAYTTINPIPGRLELVAGLFKLPFSSAELDPSARFEFAELGPTNKLLGNLGLNGRDLGLQIMGAPLRKAKRLRISLGIFRGHAKDEHDLPAGAVAGRIEAKPHKSLRLGLDAVYHVKAFTYNRPFETSDKETLPNPPDPLYPAQKRWDNGGAYGFDARFKKKGFMARGEFVYGDRVDIDRRYGALHFWSAWGILAYAFDVGSQVKLMPAFRAEWLDTDLTHGPGMFRTLSGSFTCIAWTRVRFMVDVTRTDVEANTPVLNQPKPLQATPYLALSNTRLTAQLQLEL